jgi:hypothetical protein
MTRGRWQAVSVAVVVLHASGLAYAAEPTNPAAAVVKTHIMVAPDAIAWEDCSPMPAGSFMVMPKGSPHFASARGETVVQVHAIGPWGLTYVDPKDDPRNRR